MALAILIGIGWLALTTVVGIGGIFGSLHMPLFGLGALVVGWGPLILAARISHKRKAKREGAWAWAHAEMLEAGCVAPGQGMDHSGEGTGIAINPQNRMVLLLAGGVYKSYDYEDVREWEAREERPGFAAGVGARNALAADAVNTRNAKRAAENTGLFVGVRDRQTPLWRVAMKDKMARARWMEILRQELNEGSAAARN